MATSPYKESRLWQSAMELTVEIYQLTAALPPAERLSLSSNLQRAATTIPTQIASGSRDRNKLLQACEASQAAAAELETLLLVTGQMYPNVSTSEVLDHLHEVHTLLASLAKRLSPAAAPRKAI